MNDADLWGLRAMWLVAPFAAGPVFRNSMGDEPDAFRIGTAVALWAIWAMVLIVLMVPRTWSLTTIRIAVPAAVPAFVWSVLDAGDDLSTWSVVLGGAVLSSAAVLAWRAPLADRFVDGSSYGDESRFLLRTPGPLAVGPLAIVWVLTTVAMVSGPLLLLARQWVTGGIAVVVGAPVALFGVKAFDRLSNRWLVFVPAGLVVHDKTALREPQLFRRADVDALGPAPIDASEEDLTLDAMGLALRVRLKASSKIARNGRSESPELTEIDGFLVTPNRPGAVVAEASERRFPIG